MIAAWSQAFYREWQLMRYQPQTWALPCLMALIVMSLMPFVIVEEAHTLLPRLYAVLLIWVIFLLPETWFKADFNSGYLEHYWLSPLGFEWAIAIRLLCRGILLGPSLVLILAGAAFAMGVPSSVTKALAVGLILCFPILYLLSALAAALTLKLKDSTLLCMLILMPLYCTPLILLESLIMHAQMNASWASQAYLLIAAALAAVTVLPKGIVWVLRQSLG